MAAKALVDVLDRLDAALDSNPVRYEPLIEGFRELEIPTGVTGGSLSRILSVCRRILDSDSAKLHRDLEPWQASHIAACATEVFRSILHDPNAGTREWIARMQERHRARGEAVPDDLNDDELPPAFEVPWDRATAEREIQPFLARIESSLDEDPTAHIQLGWIVARNGRSVFQPIVSDWLKGLDARSIGMPGTAAALEHALRLYDLAENVDVCDADGDAEPSPEWAIVEGEVLPLLENQHPMVATGAARFLGALFADEDFRARDDIPCITQILERIGSLQRHRPAVAGAFVCGFDSWMDGLGAIAQDPEVQSAAFDVDRWVLEIFKHSEEPYYLPNAQALWFYVHEYYCANPQFAMKLIDIGRPWIALMCATELDEPVEGMRAVLERLIEVGAGEEWVDQARRQLKEVYG